MSQTSVPQIYVLFSNSQIGVQFSNLCPFSNSQISVQFSNLWLFLTFSNRCPMTFNAIQCRIRFCFQTCLNKRVTNELFCRRNEGQAHWSYAWNFDVLHSFDIICNADDVQSWPTSIMWQGKSTYRSSLWKGHRFDKSAIDLRIWKGHRFRNTLKSDCDLRSWRQWMPIWGVDTDLSLDTDLNLSNI